MVIPYAERYTSLATGVVEGNFASPVSQVDTKDYEVCKYTNLWPISVPIYSTFVNRDAFNALPSKLQNILTEETEKMEAEVRQELLVPGAEAKLEELAKFGVTIVDVAPAELEVARQAGEIVWKEWQQEAGSEATAVMQKIIQTLGY